MQKPCSSKWDGYKMYEYSTGYIFRNMTKITTQSHNRMFVLDFLTHFTTYCFSKCSSQIRLIKCFQIVTWGFNFIDVKQRHSIQHNYEVAGYIFEFHSFVWILFRFYMFHTCIFQAVATLKASNCFYSILMQGQFISTYWIFVIRALSSFLELTIYIYMFC